MSESEIAIGAAAAQDEVVAEEQADAGQFEIALVIPTQSFAAFPKACRQPTAAGVLELLVPVSATDAVQDLRNLITESPEGFWLGACGFVPVLAEELEGEAEEGEAKSYGPWVELPQPAADPTLGIDDPKAWKLNNDGVLGDFCEISAVFNEDPAAYEGKKRGLKVIPTLFSPLAMSTHLLRFRDTLSGNLPNLNINSAYDPVAIAINPGCTIYPSVHGEESEPEAAREEPAASSSSNDKGKAKKSELSASPEPPSTEDAPPSPPALPAWSHSDVTPFTYLDHLKPTNSPLASTCVRSLGVSPWSPPPHARRMRGDIAYLTVSTLEGETFHITGAASGFWVSKSSTATFDPSPRVPTPKGVRSTPYHSLFELVSALSPAFVKSLVKVIESQSPATSMAEIFSRLPISHAIPAASWLVQPPIHVADSFRTQLAYLLTGSTSAELLPQARDWNDEFGQYRELPRTTSTQRLFRERLIHRVHCDFATAATRGAVAIARGDIPPLNPNEPVEGYTYLHNNMLFTRAEASVIAFEHLGGMDAARVAAAKDLVGVQALERLDIKGLRSMTTVLVDYLGERWVVQSLVPGLFHTKEEEDAVKEKGDNVTVYPEGDEEALKKATQTLADDKPFPNLTTPNQEDYPVTGAFRIVYGSVEPEKPDEKIRSSPYFAAFAKEVAEHQHFAEHTVKTTNGETSNLWTSTDMHGIAAPDGRSYFIDCFRMHCTDVEFLESDIDGAIATDAFGPQANGVHSAPGYPHRLPLLRLELTETYREAQLEKWVEQQVLEARAKEKEASSSVESELKEAASDPSASATDEVKPKSSPVVVQMSDFKFTYNPDAFVERKPVDDGTPAAIIYDPEAESTKNVRDASRYLREKVIPDFVTAVAVSTQNFSDSHYLAKLMHRQGINMRYLGALASLADKPGSLELPPGTLKADVDFNLRFFKSILQHAMVARSAKHILNRLLRSSSTFDHASLVAHFLNCLVGTSVEANPTAELFELPAGTKPDREWAKLTPNELHRLIVSETESRFRYRLPVAFFEPEHLLPIKLAREVCQRVGVQLALRAYNVGGTASSDVAQAGPTDNEPEVARATDPAASRKKKGGKKVVAKEVPNKASTSKVPERRSVTFCAEDVLNVMPLVKATRHKSAIADELFANGVSSFEKGNYEFGQELIQDALAFYEQIFGGVHSETSSQFHTLGIMYTNVAQGALRRVNNSEAAEEQLKAATDENREELTKRLSPYIVENVDALRAQSEHFFHQAVNMLRQSVVVAERSLGLDSSEVIQGYTDLAVLEHTVGNALVAMRLNRHVISLWTASYGKSHPATFGVLSANAQIAQSLYPLPAVIPLVEEVRQFAVATYGSESSHVAGLEYQLGQIFGLSGRLDDSVTHVTEAVRLFKELHGADGKETKEAEAFLQIVQDAAGREGREQAEKAERLRRKFPKLMADKEMRNKVGGARIGSPSSSPYSRQRVAAGSGPAVAAEPVVVETPLVVAKHNANLEGLSVDELVNFIQGPTAGPSRPARKRKVSPPSTA